MKKGKLKFVLSLILTVCLIFTSVLAISGFASGDGGYIALPENADVRLTAAADTLAKYLNRITDKTYPVAASGSNVRFVIDYTDDIADNGYIIETSENEVSIKGNGVRGVIHGVYAFLEKYCGCDWYTRDVVSVPKNENLSFTKDETKYEPFFEYTDTDWYSGDLEYSLANGLTGGVYRDIPTELGGEVGYLGGFCHTLATQYCAADKYFESNPEYFALFEGERDSGQLCLTNEKVYEIVRDEVMALLKEQHKPDEYLQIVSLTQHDNQHMCQCENCKAIDDANGSHAGTMITFVNRIAKDVKAAGYDNIAIDTFAYQYTRKTPTNVIPEDNVIVRLCTIECCFAHPLDDPNCPENVGLMEDLKNWGKICDRIYIWDYTTNYANTAGVFPDFGVLQRNIQIFLENNVKGVYEEGNYYIGSCDAEFGDLRCYLLAKLMQNPYIDCEAAMVEFNNAFYGNAGQYITDFIGMITEKPVPEGEHLMIYVDMKETLGFDNEDIEKADAIWANAENAVKNEDILLKRVQRSELCWRYWKVFNRINVSEIDNLIADMNAFGIKTISEGSEPTAPDNIKSRVFKTSYNSILSVISIAFYAIALILALITSVFALRLKKRIYPLSFLLSVGFFEIFGWNRRAYLAWRDIDHWIITLILIVILFALLGAIAVRGKKNRIVFAVVSAVTAFLLYEIGTFGVNNLIFNGTANILGIGIAFSLIGIFGIVLQSISLKNIIKEYKIKGGK